MRSCTCAKEQGVLMWVCTSLCACIKGGAALAQALMRRRERAVQGRVHAGVGRRSVFVAWSSSGLGPTPGHGVAVGDLCTTPHWRSHFIMSYFYWQLLWNCFPEHCQLWNMISFRISLLVMCSGGKKYVFHPLCGHLCAYTTLLAP